MYLWDCRISGGQIREEEMKMKKKMNGRTLLVKASAITLSILLGASAAALPARADNGGVNGTLPSSTSESDGTPDMQQKEKPYTIQFVTENGDVLASYDAGSDDTWGPNGTISVRSTFYKDGLDYDIIKGPEGKPMSAASIELEAGAEPVKVTGNLTFVYKRHISGAASETKTYQCMTEDGTLLSTFTGTADQIKPVISSGTRVYVRSDKENDSRDSSIVNVYYKLKADTNTSYQVLVQYIDDADGSVITTRTFRVDGRDYTFIAPKSFSVTSGGQKVFYRSTGETTISHKVSDTARTYQVHYQKLTAGSTEPYSWYIQFYSSETNRSIGYRTVEVKPGETASFTAPAVLAAKETSDGGKYTINKKFENQTYSHEYSDTDHTMYVYYDPEGYRNTTETRTRTISIQYVNIADGSVLQSQQQNVTSDAASEITFPESFDERGVHYRRVDGQVSSVTGSFFSPKEVYTAYYYDENNTQFRTSVITTEEVQEAVVNGPTTYRVLPGITRTVVTNTATGVSRTAATSDETGAQIARTPSGTSGTAVGTDNNIAAGTDTGTAVSAENGTEAAGAADAADGAGSGKSQDVSIDGVQADDLQTPQGNIKLDQADADSHSVRKTVLLIIGIAAAVVCAAAVILRVRRSRTGRRH